MMRRIGMVLLVLAASSMLVGAAPRVAECGAGVCDGPRCGKGISCPAGCACAISGPVGWGRCVNAN